MAMKVILRQLLITQKDGHDLMLDYKKLEIALADVAQLPGCHPVH